MSFVAICHLDIFGKYSVPFSVVTVSPEWLSLNLLSSDIKANILVLGLFFVVMSKFKTYDFARDFQQVSKED